ncbi:transporter [uncultured Eudoraea sp.]|uniref:transporter n=1 Tax=uncultured Eudoraea sp. TaxID=1035614 RepID=UPI0026265D46|nr:transporter [uncultured Eudoraea sp.]
MRFKILLIILVLSPVIFNCGYSQELEPRALTNLPKELNFVGLAYAYASGNTLLDPSLPLEDFDGQINTLILAYVRAIDFFGKSGKVDVILPFAGGDFTGIFQNTSFEDSYTGFGDLRIRASVNLTGAPSINAKDFSEYKQKTITGLALQLVIPTGNYKKEQLPNLGSNRWSLRAVYGLSHNLDNWVLEAYVGAWLFSDNKEFLGDNTLSQSALWVAKGNIIRSFKKKGMWLALSFGYGYGAESFINDIRRDATISQLRLGITYSLPINPSHTLKFTAASGIRFQQGSDFDVFGVSYVYSWLDKSPGKLKKK